MVLNDGVASSALANVVVKKISEVLDVGLAASLSWQRERLLSPANKLLDALDIAVVEIDGGDVVDQGA